MMTGFHFLSRGEQFAGHLRGELARGRWGVEMPGRPELATECGVNQKTVEDAMKILEKEGVLAGQGAGRRRRILGDRLRKNPSLRIGVLPWERADRGLAYMVRLQHDLEEAGHMWFYAPGYLSEIGTKEERLTWIVRHHPAEAWIVVAGTRHLLEWFSGQNTPAMALFGRRGGIVMAAVGPDKESAIRAATRRLLELGHRRIVLLCRKMRRLPAPGRVEQAFLDELAVRGPSPGLYHLPDWEESIDGFYACLESLFQMTPPTALIVDEVPFFHAVSQFLASRRILVPGEVSLICTDDSADFLWCRPSVAHIRWNSAPVVRRIVQWAANVSLNREDREQTLTPAEFVDGGTVGWARQGR
jgi:DNA-binding LacI/PurR family transcriptional regulator